MTTHFQMTDPLLDFRFRCRDCGSLCNHGITAEDTSETKYFASPCCAAELEDADGNTVYYDPRSEPREER